MSLLHPFHIKLNQILSDLKDGSPMSLKRAETALYIHINKGVVGGKDNEALFNLLTHHSKYYTDSLNRAYELVQGTKRKKDVTCISEAEELVDQAITRGKKIMVIIKQINKKLKKEVWDTYE